MRDEARGLRSGPPRSPGAEKKPPSRQQGTRLWLQGRAPRGRAGYHCQASSCAYEVLSSGLLDALRWAWGSEPPAEPALCTPGRGCPHLSPGPAHTLAPSGREPCPVGGPPPWSSGVPSVEPTCRLCWGVGWPILCPMSGRQGWSSRSEPGDSARADGHSWQSLWPAGHSGPCWSPICLPPGPLGGQKS